MKIQPQLREILKKFGKIFEDNNIRIEFEHPDNFIKCINDITEVLREERSLQELRTGIKDISYQLNVNTKSIESVSTEILAKVAFNSEYGNTIYKKLNNIRNLFKLYHFGEIDSYIDFIWSGQNTFKSDKLKEIKLFLLNVDANEDISTLLPEEAIDKYINSIKISEEQLNILKDFKYNIQPNSTTFNIDENEPIYYSFFFGTEDTLEILKEPILNSTYRDYVSITNILSFFSDSALEYVGIEFKRDESQYLKIEYQSDTRELRFAIDKLIYLDCFNSELSDKIQHLDCPEEFDKYKLQFVWTDKETMQVYVNFYRNDIDS